MSEDPSRSALSPTSLARMREDWDRRAREDARHYIATRPESWSDEEFYASGVESVRILVINDLAGICPGRDPKSMTALEIGCGAGRMTRALADMFGRVIGVDVSGEMVELANRALADRPNAEALQNSGADLEVLGDRKVDFAFSFIVLQHIPEFAVVRNYVREVARVLRPGGVFKFQVQGDWRPGMGEPDTWQGCAVTTLDIRHWEHSFGYRLIGSQGAGTQYFWNWFLRTEETPSEPDTEFGAMAERVRAARAALSRTDVERSEEIETALAFENEMILRAAWSHEADREIEAMREYLRRLYASPAYRLGRPLGLAPEPFAMPPNEE